MTPRERESGGRRSSDSESDVGVGRIEGNKGSGRGSEASKIGLKRRKWPLKGCFLFPEGHYSGGVTVLGAIRCGFGEFGRRLRCSTWNIRVPAAQTDCAVVGAVSPTERHAPKARPDNVGPNTTFVAVRAGNQNVAPERPGRR